MTREEQIKSVAIELAIHTAENSEYEHDYDRMPFKDGLNRGFIVGVDWADGHPRTDDKTIHTGVYWVARDRQTPYYQASLALFTQRPVSVNGSWYAVNSSMRGLPEELFPKLTFKNSPQRVRITITKEPEEEHE